MEQQPGYSHPTYEAFANRYRNAKQLSVPNVTVAPDYLQGAIIALDNQTAGILVLVGGRDFEHNQFDRALQARRPAGTAIKPFVYAAAFENGLFPGSLVEDSALDNRAVMIGGTTGHSGRMGTRIGEQPLRRTDDRAPGAGEIEERRHGPNRDDGWG